MATRRHARQHSPIAPRAVSPLASAPRCLLAELAEAALRQVGTARAALLLLAMLVVLDETQKALIRRIGGVREFFPATMLHAAGCFIERLLQQ